ncbi:helix-turn-helix domain-containing protein [Streptacidiphilus sp. EB129]|uniref:helix-turn-helix domain-containing protein n=1 Tax=Streptacidiphilus sp. EB129 TaxID=3156262 RepID=UPI0035145B47
MDAAQHPPQAPNEDEFLSREARELYQQALESGAVSKKAVGQQQPGALRELLDEGLLAPNFLDPDQLGPVHPRSAHASQDQEAVGEAMRLLAAVAARPRRLEPITRMWHAKRPDGEDGSFVRVRSKEAIGAQVTLLMQQAQRRMLFAQPGPRKAEGLEAVLPRDLEMIRRVSQWRTLYQTSVQSNAAARAYARAVTEAGAQVRTSPEFGDRLFIIDDVAIYPYFGDTNEAVFCWEPATVELLTRGFWRDWERGTEFEGATRRPTADVSGATRKKIIQLAIEGVNQESIARRLGLHKRTVARYYAELHEHYDAKTNFQLGYRVGEQASGAVVLPDDEI